MLGRDAQGLWLGVTGGTRVARPGLEFAAHGDFVVLVPDDAWWVATFNTAPGGKDHDIGVYVDITTPTTVNQGEAFTLDLDLDVVKRTNGDLGIDDEDEFKAGRGDHRFHGVRIAFSATIKDIHQLETGARRLRRILDAGPGAHHSYN